MQTKNIELSSVDLSKTMPLKDAINLLPSLKAAKFDESVDIALHLGVDARKMMVRGACSMPHGLGKSIRVAVFATGDAAKQAEKAGAHRVGLEDLAEAVMKDDIDFDVCIATPETMATVGKLGKKLGPKGIMPNPKLGTVTQDVTAAVEQALAGQVTFKLDKAGQTSGIIHCSIGKASFSADKLEENLLALLQTVKKLKPPAAKGQYMQKLYLSTTMSKASLRVELSGLVK